MESVLNLATGTLPKSNVDAIAQSLLLRMLDAKGEGVVEVFQLLEERGKDIKELREHSSRRSKAMLAGKEEISSDLIQGQILEAVYETRCLKLFLAQVCRRIADGLEAELMELQATKPRIKSVEFTEQGTVESFQLES